MNKSDSIITCCIAAFVVIIIVGFLVGEITIKKVHNQLDFSSGAKVDANDAGMLISESLGIFIVTAYCPCEQCCGDYADGITASGLVIQAGDKFVAAPKEMPFDTILFIPKYGVVPVLDRGGAIKGKRLDVFFPTHKEALIWGVKNLEIIQLKEEGE